MIRLRPQPTDFEDPDRQLLAEHLRNDLFTRAVNAVIRGMSPPAGMTDPIKLASAASQLAGAAEFLRRLESLTLPKVSPADEDSDLGQWDHIDESEDQQ